MNQLSPIIFVAAAIVLGQPQITIASLPDALTYQAKGFLNMHNKEYLEAIANYSKAIEIEPNYVRGYVFRGFVYKE
jgi:tetratricopeptide (TPR) repeat protein